MLKLTLVKCLLHEFCQYKFLKYKLNNLLIIKYNNNNYYINDYFSILTFQFHYFLYLRKNNYFFQFLKKYFHILYSLKNKYSKKILLNGLGFRISFINNFLEFKIGFSHLKRVFVPKIIEIKILKNLLILRSFDINILSNFIYELSKLKSLNSYKGKGFLLKNKKIIIKTFKK